MAGWRDTALLFGSVPELGTLTLSAEPAIVFARDGSRVLWANPAAGEALGAKSLAALVARPLSTGLRRAVASLARSVPEGGTMGRLRLSDDLAALPVLCRCRPIRAGSEGGLLVVAPSTGGAEPDEAAVVSFLAEPEVAVEAGAATGGPAPWALDGPGLSAVAAQPMPTKRKEVSSPEPAWVASPEPKARPAAFGEVPRPMRPAPSAEFASVPPLPTRDEEAAGAGEETAPSEEGRRSVKAGRVLQELQRKPVRFLWQTDAADRFLFVSPGLAQVVGRNAEVIGERWGEVSARLRLDPHGRIAAALRRRDTWSGLTAWWPIEGSSVRVPVELTALPVFGGDQSFQGYRGFGILRPAEALMPATFETRFGATGVAAEPRPPYEESPAPNVVPIRADIERVPDGAKLSALERNAFEEIAAALRERVVDRWPEVAAPPTEAEETKVLDTPAAPSFEGARPEILIPRPFIEPHPAERERASASQPAVSGDGPSAAGNSELAEARRRLREMTAVLDTATDGVIILDAEGAIESVNASAEALFGLEAAEMVDRPFVDLLTSDSRRSALDYLSGLRDSGVASLLNEGREVEALAGAGSIPLFMTMGRISSDEGERFCAVLRDITHWKRMEADLTTAKQAAERASSQKSEFLSRVGNEIRNPLNAIVGLAEAMIEERSGPIDNERYREYLREIRVAGEQVVNLVDDLLDISRVEVGKLDLAFAAVPLNETVREAIGLVQGQANRARAVLRSSLSKEVPAIVGDERTLRQAILNLLANAVRHAGPGGQVIVSTSLGDSGEALVRIRDTGPGMTDDEVAQALEPFRGRTPADFGDRSESGLGLPLTKALIEANRASLSIRSARGDGTVMTVTIPPTRVLSE